MTATQRELEETAGAAMIATGLRKIHEANGGDDREVRRAIAGAIAAYMVHIAKVHPMAGYGLWIIELGNMIMGAYKRTADINAKRAGAVPGSGTLQ